MDNYTQLVNKILTENIDNAPLVKSYIEEDADPVMTILQKYPSEVEDLKNGGELAQNLYEELFEYYLDLGEIPYGVAKARTGDPYEWVYDKLDEIGVFREVEDNEAVITDADLKTLEIAKKIAGDEAQGGKNSNPEKAIQKELGKGMEMLSTKLKQVFSKASKA